MNYNQFIEFVQLECNKYEIILDLRNTKTISGGNGEFSEIINNSGKIIRKLSCAINKPKKEWFPVFVHEYCHMTQCIENISLWKVGGLITDENYECPYGSVINWIKGKKVKKNIWIYIDHIKHLEYDCEKRAINIIKKYNLPINLEDYTQKAYSYIHIYNYIALKKRKNKTGKPPYNYKKIYSIFPKKLGSYKDFDSISMEYVRLVDKYCF